MKLASTEPIKLPLDSGVPAWPNNKSSSSFSGATPTSSKSSLMSNTLTATSMPNCAADVDSNEDIPGASSPEIQQKPKRNSSLPDLSSECTVLANYHAINSTSGSGKSTISSCCESPKAIKSVNSSNENLALEDRILFVSEECSNLFDGLVKQTNLLEDRLACLDKIVTTPKMPTRRSDRSLAALFSESLRPRSGLSYINDQTLSEFFVLTQQLQLSASKTQLNGENCAIYSATFAKLSRFFGRLFCEHNDIEPNNPLDSLVGSEYQLDRYVSNSCFASLVNSNLFLEPTLLSSLNVRFEREELWGLVEWLYPDSYLRPMFNLLEQVKRCLRASPQFGELVKPKLGQSSNKRHRRRQSAQSRIPRDVPTHAHNNRSVFDSIRELTVRHSKTPLLDSLHRLSAANLMDRIDSRQMDLLLLIFCYRAAIFEYKSRGFNGDMTANDCDGDGPTVSPDHGTKQQLDPIQCFSLSSSSFVRQLYQVTVQLTLLASCYVGHIKRRKLICQLLRIRPQNLQVQTCIQQALDLFNYETIALSQEIDMMATLNLFENEVELRMASPTESPNDFFSTSSNSSSLSPTPSSSSSTSSSTSTSSPSSPLPSPSTVPPDIFDINNNSGFIEEDDLLDDPNQPETNVDPGTFSDSIEAHQLIPLYLQGKRELLEKIKAQGISLLAPINNRWSFQECGVCCDTLWLLVRSCCNFPVCLDCLHRYYTARIELGNLSIECIGPECKDLAYRSEVSARLAPDTRALYSRLLLVHSSESARAKPCPQCNTILTLSPQQESTMKRATKRLFAKRILLRSLGKGDTSLDDSAVFKVKCDRCQFDWCFKCHSPWHHGLSCKQNLKGDALLKTWAKRSDYAGQINAQKCPRCKTYIQRTSGCDHMHCTRCLANFCYKCGDQLRNVKFFGDHYSKLSVLGCKYRYKPDNPFQRRLVRGTVFGSKLVLLPVLSTVCLCAGAVVLALGVAALPLFGGMRIYRQLKHRSSKFVHPSTLFVGDRQHILVHIRPNPDGLQNDLGNHVGNDDEHPNINNADIGNLVGTFQMTPLQLARLFDGMGDGDQDSDQGSQFDFAEMLSNSVAMHTSRPGNIIDDDRLDTVSSDVPFFFDHLHQEEESGAGTIARSGPLFDELHQCSSSLEPH